MTFDLYYSKIFKSNQAKETKSIIPSTSKNTTPVPTSSPAAVENREKGNSVEITENTESSLIIGSNNDLNDGDSDIFGKF